MELSRMAAQQKRVHYWRELLQHGMNDAKLRERFSKTLEALQKLLSDIWDRGKVESSDKAHLEALTREIEQMEEESRLSAR